MLSKILAASVVALGALAATAPANAHGVSFSIEVGAPTAVHDYRPADRDRWYHDDYDRQRHTLSAKEVRRILRNRGYRDISYVDRRGKIYQVHARDYRGRRVGLVVSARSGAILTAYRL
ncbi:MAG TPA: hypothetical protein VN240_03595 [Propylenella sp.]|nr:hypothetical protein [Propylenella sp.]